jgi:hypothetical protein
MGSCHWCCCSTRCDTDTFGLANGQVMADFVVERGRLGEMMPTWGCLTWNASAVKALLP